MQLDHLVAAVPGAWFVRRTGAREVRAVSDHDADIGADDVFVAIRGARFDGHARVPSIRAAAVIVDQEVEAPEGVTIVQVPDTRRALAPACAAALEWPGRAVPVVGVTGTNGKTSTTFMLADIARAAGLAPGIIGTTGNFVGDRRVDTQHTSPTAPVLQALLAQMRAARVGLCALEASSIGLAAFRCDAIPFRAAIFTNLTRDHLDWHGSMEAYAAAKARLFHELLEGTAILNADDPAHAAMIPANRAVWTFSATGPADIRATLTGERWEGLEAAVATPRGAGRLRLPMIGRHNLQNALGALGAALSLGIDLDVILRGLATCTGAPGRLERIPTERGFGVFVDYAHTDDALSRVLGELRRLKPARILCVFGCGGDRDRGKRPLMGQAVALGADHAIVTSDNPRSEDPLAIIADILPGLGTAAHHVESDRAAAIRLAIGIARAGDVVLIAGKGHEPFQEIAGVKHPFDDRAVARQALA
ncbi:UDP-N-acetylmuramoyl-L-alanyl-D-glutamate--2,6-diaminopimelate ligase [Deltaproteobacteria bacterium]|nr:UDP-N-acetylmuramoyl-L-alanyl-D-glutamate--2,6-diaminopimelate ligase [Deltaproteobacteria bacterium]